MLGPPNDTFILIYHFSPALVAVVVGCGSCSSCAYTHIIKYYAMKRCLCVHVYRYSLAECCLWGM